MKPNKEKWSKVYIPHELNDMLLMVAKANGYKRDQMHLFLYHLLKVAYPADVQALADYLETRWLDVPPADE